ncbi:MAG: hypothetical protein N3B16_04390 [Candidatus Aminicenantes bacterium]|nr:hypothetical protein [Candidatus Aminicenantes bacterium]
MNILLVVGLTCLLVLILFLVRELTDILAWGPLDFGFVWLMVLSTSIVYELITRKHKNKTYRLALAVALGTGFIMIWTNLAVGLIGSEDEPVNMIYLVLLAGGLIGALLVRLKARGLTITMGIMALGQVLITLIALLAGWQHLPSSSVSDILKVNGFFFLLWQTKMYLFDPSCAFSLSDLY